jgi:hypothetical protein
MEIEDSKDADTEAAASWHKEGDARLGSRLAAYSCVCMHARLLQLMMFFAVLPLKAEGKRLEKCSRRDT